MLGGVPRESQLPQPFPGTVCQICQSAPSWPLTSISRCPSLFFSTVGGDIILAALGKPREAQLLQVPFGVVCQICQSAPSEPTVKTSSRPSVFCITEGGNWAFAMDAVGWPEENQLNQAPCPGAVCQLCQSAPSEPTVKTSSRPSAFFPTPGTLTAVSLGG